MKKREIYEFPEIELTEFRTEEGVFASQIESVQDEDYGDPE